MRTFALSLILLLSFAFVACGGSPSSPSATGTFGAQIDGRCAQVGVTSATVTVDGRILGPAIPGGVAVTTQVPLGGHTISARANNGLVWNDSHTLTNSQPDFVYLFFCQ